MARDTGMDGRIHEPGAELICPSRSLLARARDPPDPGDSPAIGHGPGGGAVMALPMGLEPDSSQIPLPWLFSGWEQGPGAAARSWQGEEAKLELGSLSHPRDHHPSPEGSSSKVGASPGDPPAPPFPGSANKAHPALPFEG